jgi:hypothetical protein
LSFQEIDRSSSQQKELEEKLKAVEEEMASNKVKMERELQAKLQKDIEEALENELVCSICSEYFVQVCLVNIAFI